MRILFLSTWFPYPLDNGSKIRAHYLLKALAERHEVTLVSFASGTAQPGEAHELNEFCQAVHAVRVDPFLANQTGAIRRFASVAPVATRLVPEMHELVRQVTASGAFDVVVASTQVMASYALQSAGARARILEEHNSLSRWMWERYVRQQSPLQRIRCWLAWRKARGFERRLFAQFDLITMVSKQDCEASEDLLAGQGDKVKLVPNGVDVNRNCPPEEPAGGTSLVYSGSLTYHANLDAMIYFISEVYPSIKQQIPEVTLSITGSHEGVNVEKFEQDQSICLTGYVPDTRPVVSGAGAAVAPIRVGSGTRLKILEAMALGTPVVATSKGAEGLEVADGRDILIADDSPSFANMTIRVLRDSELSGAIARNARRLVEEQYDWTLIGRSFVQLVEQCAADGCTRVL